MNSCPKHCWCRSVPCHHHSPILAAHPLLFPTTRCVYFLLKEQPSVRRALPPVGWQRTCEQPWQTTTVWACEKTVVMVKQPGHLTSMKKERGPGTSCCDSVSRGSSTEGLERGQP